MDTRRTGRRARGNRSIRDYASVQEKAETSCSTSRLPCCGHGTWSAGVSTSSALRQPSLVNFLKKNKGKKRTASTPPVSPVTKQSKGVPASLISRGVRKKAISVPSATVRPEASSVVSSQNKENWRARDDGSLKSNSVLSACEEQGSSEDSGVPIREPLSERTSDYYNESNLESELVSSNQPVISPKTSEDILLKKASRNSASKRDSFEDSPLSREHKHSPSRPRYKSKLNHDCDPAPGARVITPTTSGDPPLVPETCSEPSFEYNTDELLAELSYCGKVRL